MDYEKAYKEALERAKNIKSKILQSHLSTESCKAVSEYIDEVIPELREDEDERIRKRLLKYFQDFKPVCDNEFLPPFTIDDILAWLEKQKEKKFDFELIKQAWYMEGYKDREFGKESKWIIKTGDGGPEYELNPRYGQSLAKEQKSAEIDFEDWDTLGYIRDIVRKHVRRDEEFNALDKWLTEHYVIQKPAEKQDYSGLNDLEQAIHRGFLSAGVENVPVTIIKETAKECLAQQKPADLPAGFYVTLPDGKKYYTKEMRCKGMNIKVVEPKPAEWSEKDKKILDDVSHILIGLNYKQIAKDYKQAVEKLIYARPSWKPSEEQMEALRIAAYEPHKNWNEKLQELYDDLLKLK